MPETLGSAASLPFGTVGFVATSFGSAEPQIGVCLVPAWLGKHVPLFACVSRALQLLSMFFLESWKNYAGIFHLLSLSFQFWVFSLVVVLHYQARQYCSQCLLQ